MILTLLLRFSGFSLLCFGGGYILIPLLFADLVTQRGILAANEFLNLVSIAQLTPGPVGINTATYSGYLEGGVWGSLAATAGFVLPTLFLASLAVAGLRKYRDSFFVRGLMTGVRPAAVGMITYAALLFLRLSLFAEKEGTLKIDWISLAVFGITLILMLKSKISAFRLIVCGAALGALSALL
ncbi:MAG: chromate transporter [Victivallaceae bacterium]|nr:chromate transporter [Victivallaceae bacterium]